MPRFGTTAPSFPDFLGLSLIIYAKSNLVLDPREPPLFKSRIPIIGHIVRMWRDGGGYYVDIYRRLGTKTHPVTLSILGQKFYFLLSPSIVQAAFRNRYLTSERFNVQAATGVVGLRPEPLRNMTSTALRTLSADLNELAASSCKAGKGPIDLYRFLRDRLGTKTNPVRIKTELVQDVCYVKSSFFSSTFDEAMFILLFNIAPTFTAPAGHKARGRLQEVLIESFQKYPDDSSFPDDAAELTRMRARLLRMYGVTDVDVGNMEIGMFNAAVANTAPILFWMVVSIFSRPKVLANPRAEVEKLVEVTDWTATLCASQLTDRNLCPYVAAVNYEVMRLCDSATGTRFVDEDITLPDGTLLKSGALVDMPSAVAHRMEETWGSHDPEDFNPERSLRRVSENRNPRELIVSEPLAQRKAFWPFGGGKHLCPGRNFAFAENIIFLAALAVGFEVKGLDVDTIPQCGYANLAGQSVPKPKQPANVTFRQRNDWENVKWRLIA
ncbi:cytochrome P450 [Colletotrichum navitas]|uniref:Cytochrome P450 n=1 Tax=Colletotrichum navitas TaxID=681940 RepID=A0AAD8PNU8_9PEZI|nr:cytochrome P450 [Colletotrichum navitas]KAK1573081.1 cytochrome P450 [Colletotrichum navitas]